MSDLSHSKMQTQKGKLHGTALQEFPSGRNNGLSDLMLVEAKAESPPGQSLSWGRV